MPDRAPFEVHTGRYDRWFDRHEPAYRSEVAALAELLPEPGRGLEVGVGTGRFAAPLGIEVGIDPAASMHALARERGVATVRGVGERLPFVDDAVETVLLVTTICFLDDVARALAEAHRVLGPTGSICIGYVDRDGPLGRRYRRRAADSPFYVDASFVSTPDLVERLEAVGFDGFEFVQTIFSPPEALEEPDRIEPGFGEGSFVGLRGDA